MNNKNKNMIIIILSITVIFLAISMISTSLIKTSNNINNNIDKQNEDAIEAFYTNYLITYFLEDNIKTSNETYINNKNETYYLVTDELVLNELLKQVHSSQDFANLLKENFNDNKTLDNLKNFMNSEYTNKYVSNNGKLYVKKTSETCQVNNGIKLEINDISFNEIDNQSYLIYKNNSNQNSQIYPINRDNNGKIKVTYLWFNCSDKYKLYFRK